MRVIIMGLIIRQKLYFKYLNFPLVMSTITCARCDKPLRHVYFDYVAWIVDEAYVCNNCDRFYCAECKNKVFSYESCDKSPLSHAQLSYYSGLEIKPHFFHLQGSKIETE